MGIYGWVEPFVLPYPAGMSKEERQANAWRNFRKCPACGAEKGECCRTPACAQLKYAPPELRDKFPKE
ncbi:hypothetical protein [Burkholderia phage BCSR5]|nr:hypothetical protein [Burkholderia phage BCSR5]